MKIDEENWKEKLERKISKDIINSQYGKGKYGFRAINYNLLIKDVINKTKNKIERQNSEIREDRTGQMLQQMQGFKIGKWSDIITLAISSGLSKKEWKYIKENEESGHLDEKDIKELDEHFNLKEKVQEE